MAEPTTYKCPQCSATLRLANPVPAGKKIKCPKCQNVFAPPVEQPKAAAGKPAGVSKPPLDEDDAGAYALKDDPPPPEPVKRSVAPLDFDEDDAPKKKKKKTKGDEDELDTEKPTHARKKSAAQAMCQAPSNKMLATSCFTCASCLLSLLVSLWPLIFMKERSWTNYFLGLPIPIPIMVLLLIGAFVYNAAIAVSAVKMQSIESYAFAMLGSTLCVIPASWLLGVPAFFWFYKFLGSIMDNDPLMPGITMVAISALYIYIGMWNMRTLRDPAVVEGFEEKGPEYGD